MSNKPLILTQNLFENVVLNPTYTLGQSGTDDASSHELFRIADNLRDMTYWTTNGANSARTIYADALTSVSPNIAVLDRGHNLRGATVVLKSFTDTTLGSPTTIATCTIPSSAGGLASDANGCLTPDGVWWKTFTPQANRVQGMTIPALGSGVAPIVTGFYMGTYFRFPEMFDAPAAYDYATDIKYFRNELSRGGVRSKSRGLNLDRISIKVQTESTDYAGVDTELRRIFRYNAPWWFCLDDSDATGCSLMRLFQLPGDMSYRPQVNPVHRELTFEGEEVIPTLYV